MSRRAVLRGGGALALGLPMLDIMLGEHGEALAGGEPLPRRFITWMFGNGVDLEAWEPEQTGPGFVLPQVLSELEPVADYVSVCSGMEIRSANFITHHEGMIGFSGYNYELRPELPNFASDWGGPTIDQRVADAIADEVTLPVRSLQLGVSRHLSPVDNGTTAEALSVRGEPGNLVPLPPQFQPAAVWETLFGEFVPGPDDTALRQSALDLVKADADRLKAKLGMVDTQRVDAHLQGVFELEQKIAALPPPCDLPPQPTLVNDFGIGAEPLTELNQVMSDLVAIAFACDVTRVASMQFLHIAAEVPLGEAGQVDTHHNYSHANDDTYRAGLQYIFGRVSDLMQTLQAVDDGNGTTALDNSIVYVSSDTAVGFTHQMNRMPVLLGGAGGGHLVHPGIHYQSVAAGDPNSPDAPTAGNVSDIMLSCLQAFDADATEVGADEPYSNTPLADIIA
ncbi:MAG: DUF1552 domain-containing protein [Myxococcota bacterium]